MQSLLMKSQSELDAEDQILSTINTSRAEIFGNVQRMFDLGSRTVEMLGGNPSLKLRNEVPRP